MPTTAGEAGELKIENWKLKKEIGRAIFQFSIFNFQFSIPKALPFSSRPDSRITVRARIVMTSKAASAPA